MGLKIFHSRSGQEKRRYIKPIRIRSKLLFSLIPMVIIILLATGYVTHFFSQKFLQEALGRTVQSSVLAATHEVESRLDLYASVLQELSEEKGLSFQKLRHFGQIWRDIFKIDVCEIAFIARQPQKHLYIVQEQGHFCELGPEKVLEIQPSPLLLFSRLEKNSTVGKVHILPIIRVLLPVPYKQNYSKIITTDVIRLFIPYNSIDKGQTGFVLMSVYVRQIKSILSVYNSKNSPLFAFDRSPELRYYYLFTPTGWILFDSQQNNEKNLTTELVQTSYTGNLGLNGILQAFKPAAKYNDYWEMVENIRKGMTQVKRLEDNFHLSNNLDSYFLSYAPIFFREQKFPYVGLAYIDRSRLGLQAGYRHTDIMFIITISTVIIISFFIYMLSWIITSPILKLARFVNDIYKNKEIDIIKFKDYDYETTILKNSINNMIIIMKNQLQDIKNKDAKIEYKDSQQRVEFKRNKNNSDFESVKNIIGTSKHVQNLKKDILRAAKVDVDILITGETGTGKQLAAEAIHSHSKRSTHEFIAINCGALDENLLLDTLFGHAKGAFTEAKESRKGAFVLANNGTIFLDEIANSSLKVQQSLLTALSTRKIRPLGSDKEIDIDIRVIAATNINLLNLSKNKLFREDLYYRLKVLTIDIVALRDRKDDIPILCFHFLHKIEKSSGKENIGLSKGALEKMNSHDWPGNIRELENCITRAVVMSSQQTIQAEDISLEQDKPGILPQSTALEQRLNPRQKKVISLLQEGQEFSRQEYQDMVGQNLASRTALHDLQDLLKKGVLLKKGKGPQTKYELRPPNLHFSE